MRNYTVFDTIISVCKNIQHHDCCGGRLCGDPLTVKEHIDDVLSEKKPKY